MLAAATHQTLQGAKYRWKLPQEHAGALDIAASYNISIAIAQTLCARGYVSREQIDSFLFTSLEKDVAHASLLKDAEKAVDRIIYAIDHKEKILVAGDYDVDGITSSSLMLMCLMPLGADINFFLPNRIRDGYGLSIKVVERAAANNYKLIITVDNGITALAPAARAKELGIDLIITDHHQPHAELPDAFAIVNPHQKECGYPFKLFAGVGVIFKVLSLLYERKNLPLPSKVYELLLLGTIADVVPLIGENRFWVRHGLRFVNEHESISLKVLKANGRLTKPVMKASDIGFSITPQINALGRLEDARQGVRFLIGSDSEQVRHIGTVLFELNEARKLIEQSVLATVQADIATKRINLEQENIILAVSDQWPAGVIGLVASRLVGAYGKPALLFHATEGGMVKGSCRSIPEFNIFQALQDARHIITQFGGHAMAAGLSLPQAQLPALKRILEERILTMISVTELRPRLTIDAVVRLSDLTKKFITDLEFLEPFGNSNPYPLFQVKEVMMVQKPQLLKDAHVKCSVFADGVIKPVIFFNRPELYAALNNHNPHESFDLAVQVQENYWNGKISIELTGTDIALGKQS